MTDTTILRSDLILNAIRAEHPNENPYPYAFGYAWAMLSAEARKQMLDHFTAETEN